MRVGSIRIPCKDLALSEDFYTNKLGLNCIFGSINDGFVGYQLENAQVIIEPEEKGEFECGRFLGFSIDVVDIDAFYQSKRALGVKFTGPPEKQAWGGIMTHVVDASGNSFSIVKSQS